MGLTTTAGAPVVRVVNGMTYSFPMLRKRKVGELIATWAAEDRAKLAKTIDESGVDPAAKLDRLRDFDIEAGTLSYGYRCLFQVGRTLETILASLQVSNPTANDDDLDRLPFSPDDLWSIAAELWGVRRPAEKTDASDPQPPSPENDASATA